jgi:hypothetical protein
MVAVKLIRTELAGNPDFRRRFAQEVRAAKQVGGIFTAPVVDADPDGPQPWLVTTYVAGPSLADAIISYGVLPVEVVRILAAGLAEGLRAIHAAGIVHRDLKPSNVLLAADGPRIIDFGVSLAAGSTWLTGGRVIGSPGFMSPEQAEGRDVGTAADVFSFGGVLVFAASGRPPFGTGSTSAVLHRVVYSTAALGHVPAQLRPMVERCLAKDPATRPTTDQLLAELGRAQLTRGWLSRPAHHAAAPAGRRELPPDGRPAYDVLADRTRPARLGWPRGRALAWAGTGGRIWRGRRAIVSWAAAATVAAASASAFAVMASGHHATGHPSADAIPVPRTDQRKHIPHAKATAAGPRSVIRAYFAAINARNWPKVWRIGGRNLSPSYTAMVAGYTGTVRDVYGLSRVSGDRVVVWLRARESGGLIQTFKIKYTVRNGIIVAGEVLSTSTWPAGAVRPASSMRARPAAPRPPSRSRMWSGSRASRPGQFDQPNTAPATDA